jgi:DNA-binding NtrC family response regulator
MKEIKFPANPVLLVDDEERFLESVSFTLSSAGINNIEECQDSRDVMKVLSEQRFGVIVLDLFMPFVSGLELLPAITHDFPEIPVIIITAVNELDTAVECMKSGAFDYLVKPVDDERLITSVKRAVQFSEMRNENTMLKKYLLSDQLNHPEAFSEIITKNSTMRSIFQYVEAIGSTHLPVFITGETGTGKELLARAIHMISGRKGDFVAVNVAGVDDNLFSDMLFGHKKGAFTGADRDRKGMIEQSAGGTLFLDEIGDLSAESQVKLLRLLQEGQYYPVGSDIPKISDARVVAATNKDIESLQESRQFRKDLYYRLEAHHVHIPPFRGRTEDIPFLVDHFLREASKNLGKKKPTPPRELFTLLSTYNFPGNVRELQGLIYDAVSTHKSGILSMDSFRAKITHKHRAPRSVEKGNTGFPETDKKKALFTEQLPTLKEVEHLLIEEAMKRAKGNQTIAAEILGMSRRALNNRLMRQHKNDSEG